jgi:ADP-ribose pyrophosphatase YjhB (NUDIX family)
MSEQQEQHLGPTHVVTCFLQRNDPNDLRILIVQRSERVGSYHAHWAGISGFIEPGVTPDEQAYTEIREETGLQADQVRMVKRGQVVEHVDEELGRHFYVHPFLFFVLAPERIQTDWEAVDMRWIDPFELRNYQTVPKLPEAYESALHGESVE